MIEIDNYLVSCAEDTNSIVWNLESGEEVRILEGHQGKSVWSIAVCPVRKLIVTGGSDSGIKLWPLVPLLT